MRSLFFALFIAASAATSAACGRPATSAATAFAVRPVPPPSEFGSEPQMSVSDRGVILSWVERSDPKATTLKFAERTPSGWTAPMIVASGTDWFVSYADPPSVMRLSNGTLVAQWERQTHRFIEAMDLHLSYSTDNGKSWSPPFMPHHDGTQSQHAFASLFELPGSTLGLVWLDGRATVVETEDPAGGAMGLRYAAFDAGWRQVADQPVDTRVCECCSTTIAPTANGFLLAFRDRSADEVRDISVSRFENGRWTPIAPVHDDGWTTYACPVNGPALSAQGRRAVVAWFTVRNDRGEAYAAFSNDAGQSWGTPIRLDEAGSLGRVAVQLLDDGSAAALWIEFAGGRGQLRMRRIDASGGWSPAVTLAGVGDGRASGFPRLARYADELVVAWTESASQDDESGRSLKLQTAIARLP